MSSIFETTQGTQFAISADAVKVIPTNDPTDKTKWIEGGCATNEISYTGGQKSDIDVTSLCSVEQEVTNGLSAPAEVTISRNWSREDDMLKELEKAYEDNELRAYKVTFPSGNGFIFLAEIRQASWSIATAGKVAASYSLRLRGRPSKIISPNTGTGTTT